MAKKKIGCAEVKDGVARGWFTIPENLKRGVYELLGEYQGNEVYKPSYDLKYLIIGLGTEFQGIQASYTVDEYNRELTITGRLVGYNELNEEVGLENEKVQFKIGAYDNPLELSDEERSLDAINLATVLGEEEIVTGDNGFFKFQCYVPDKFKDWEYQLYLKFAGNYEYVSCIKSTLLRIGCAPTYTRLELFPNEPNTPNNHLHPQGAMILRASVYLAKDVDSFGVPKEGVERIKYGDVTIKWADSENAEAENWINIPNFGDTPSDKQPLDRNNGWVIHRHEFNGRLSDVYEKWIVCEYSGSKEDICYKPSKSRVIHITVDQYGEKGELIRMQLETLDTEQRAVFYVYGDYPDKLLTFDYGDDTKPVPIGYTLLTVKEQIENV